MFAHAAHGDALVADSPPNGWAGLFRGKVSMSRYLDIGEDGTPGPPPIDIARIFVRDNAGKTKLPAVSFGDRSLRRSSPPSRRRVATPAAHHPRGWLRCDGAPALDDCVGAAYCGLSSPVLRRSGGGPRMPSC